MEQAIVEAIPVPSILVGQNARIVRSNLPARDLFGETIDNRNYITALRQPQLLECVETVLRLRQKTTTTYTGSQAQRDVRWHVTGAPTVVDGSACVLLVFEDRTALQEAGQIRRDFVANVSHELRTPLTALLGFIETLKGAAKDDEIARQRFLGIMEKEANRMSRLVQDLLSLSRVEAQARERPTGGVDIGALVHSVLVSMQSSAKNKDIDISYRNDPLDDADNKEKTLIAGDADQLAQVLTNLTENAIKYSGRGAKVTVSTSFIERDAVLRAPAVRIEVSDTGDGIDSVHIPRLTERFYRIDTHRSREQGGTGLGLAIVKHIVNRHRGRIEIESRLGHGSVFRVTLPAQPLQSDESPH